MSTTPVNRYQCVCWVARDPEEKGESPSGQRTVHFPIVVNKYLRGNKKIATWAWVVAYGWMADKLVDRHQVKKGQQLFLEAELRSWRAKDGSTRNELWLEHYMLMRAPDKSGWSDEELTWEDQEGAPF